MEKETAQNKKYILLENDTKEVNGRTLHRIKCIKESDHLTDGLLGGYIESESNLSQSGECWICPYACVYGDAVVENDAIVAGTAQVYDNARIVNKASINGEAKVFGNASVSGCAKVNEQVQIFDNAFVAGNAHIHHNAQIFGRARVTGNTIIQGDSLISENAAITEDAEIREKSEISGSAQIGGNTVIESSKVTDTARITGESLIVNSNITGSPYLSNVWIACSNITGKVIIEHPIKIMNEIIKSKADFIVFKNWWSSGRTFAYFTRSDKFRVGCFYGTGAELVKKAYNDNYEKGKQYKAIVDYVESIKQELFYASARNEKY